MLDLGCQDLAMNPKAEELAVSDQRNIIQRVSIHEATGLQL